MSAVRRVLVGLQRGTDLNAGLATALIAASLAIAGCGDQSNATPTYVLKR